MISRRKFLKSSSEAGVAIAATSAGLGTMLVESIDRSAEPRDDTFLFCIRKI